MAEKFLFTEDPTERFTQEALEFDSKLSIELRKHFKAMIAEGYGSREIACLMHECVSGLMYEFLLEKQIKAAKNGRNKT